MKLDLKPVLAVSAMVLGVTHTASAATQIGNYLTFNGFGTLGAVQTDTNSEQYMRDGQPTGAVKDKTNFNVDSNLGLQLTAQPTRWLSGTVQLLTQEREQPNLSTEVEWAFVKVQPVNGLSIRGGRMALPMFFVSDTRNVGYANTWIRPPNEVYGLALLHRMEGGDISYRLPLGSTSLSLSALAGKSYFYLFGQEADVENVKGASAQLDTDIGLTLRVSRVQGDVVLSSTNKDRYTFSDIGAAYDRGNIVAQAEYVTRRSAGHGDTVDADGWYVLGGYRLNNVTPYASYAATKPKYSQGTAALISGRQATVAVGVRWEAFASAAVKFQLERTDTDGTTGLSFITERVPSLIGPPASAPVTSPVNIASLAIDFVF